jgi:hypothetical protein
MGRFLDENGRPTSDEKAAAVSKETGNPVENPARQIWVTETALSTALNTSYFAEQVSEFAIVMGIALLLTGLGFLVLTLGALRVALRTESETEKPASPAAKAGPLPA